MDGLSLTIGGTLGAAIVSAIVKIWTSRNGKVAVEPSPLDVRRVQDCVSVKECNRRMAEMGQRISNLELQINTGFTTITDKLDALDSKSEERAVAINRRIDPLMAELARSQGQVEFIKDLVNNAYRQATVGGHK